MSEIKEYFISEMEWWDRVAMATDMLDKIPNAQKKVVQCEKDIIEWHGNEDFSRFSVSKESPTKTVYIFNNLKHVEILRRLNQMPDETPLDFLILPFSLYCPEMGSLVSINNPSTSLAEHLSKLKGDLL